ncbi:hypothetical protein CJ030_MR6G000517 [Morella rubra]|uniref:Disease resistance RPP13-like protein 1 n=1 Tax=Morella rubra TaxID=262757 RepID=A0A6A1V832_9ROSI|nr:hypothetical protein CJ030_MR6G000517 [Morella rubra]
MLCFGAENEDGAFFTNLEQLWIEDCPKLTGALPIHLPSLNRLLIKNCPRLVASLPMAPGLTRLKLKNSEGVPLSELPAGMNELKIEGYNALESLPEGIIDSNDCLLSTLKILRSQIVGS